MKKLLLAFLMLLVSVPAGTIHADTPEPSVKHVLRDRGFQETVDLGPAASAVTMTSGVFGNEGGRTVYYAVTNGGFFNAMDADTLEILYSEKIPVQLAWGHTIDHNGIVYIAGLDIDNKGVLYSYNPEGKVLTFLGNHESNEQFWSITVDEVGNVYIGTFNELAGQVLKYDPVSKAFSSYGQIDADKKLGYVRSIAYKDGYVYAGTGNAGRLYRIDVKTGEKVDLTKNAYEILDKQKPNSDKNEVGFLYDLDVIGDHLVARLDVSDSNALMFYNLVKEEWENKVFKKEYNGKPEDKGAMGFQVLPSVGNKFYLSYNQYVHEFDLDTFEAKSTGIKFGAGFTSATVVDTDKGKTVYSVLRAGEMARLRLETGVFDRDKKITLKALPLKLHNLGKDNKGNLYVTTYPGGPKGAQYDINKETYSVYNQGQAEGMIAGSGNDMYFGIYGGALIQKMDTETLAIENLFELKTDFEQDRPYILNYVDGMILIGTIPDYGKLGGTMTILNPETGDRKTYRNVIEGQSIVGLTHKDGKIYGSTTIKGGLDASPTAETASIFVWDIETERVVKEIKAPFEDLNKPPLISGLTFDDKGQLWGAVDGILFTMNPETYEFTKHKNIYPDIVDRGLWRPVHIEFGEDGLLYTDISGRMTIVDPASENWDHVTINTEREVDWLVLSHDKNGQQNAYILQSAATSIEMIPVVDVAEDFEADREINANILLPVVNPSFEEMNEAQKDDVSEAILGWTPLSTITPNVSYKLTQDKAFDGKTSLFMSDTAQNEDIFLTSTLIPVQEGKTYTTRAKLYLEDQMSTLMVRYFDENGKQVGKDTDAVNIIHVRSNYKTWQNVEAVVEAPAGAKFIKIFVGTANYFTTNGAYWDDFSVSETQTVLAKKTKQLQATIAKLENETVEGFTEDTVTEFVNALAEAKELLSTIAAEEASMVEGITKEAFAEIVTQETVDAMNKKLNDAFNGLVLEKEEPGEEEPGKEEPGKEEPGKEEPGKEEPGKEEPGKEEPGKGDFKPETSTEGTLPSTGMSASNRLAFGIGLFSIGMIIKVMIGEKKDEE